jgi:hypothetical protein
MPDLEVQDMLVMIRELAAEVQNGIQSVRNRGLLSQGDKQSDEYHGRNLKVKPFKSQAILQKRLEVFMGVKWRIANAR